MGGAQCFRRGVEHNDFSLRRYQIDAKKWTVFLKFLEVVAAHVGKVISFKKSPYESTVRGRKEEESIQTKERPKKLSRVQRGLFESDKCVQFQGLEGSFKILRYTQAQKSCQKDL